MRQATDNGRLIWLPVGMTLIFVAAGLSQARVQVLDRATVLYQAEETRRYVVSRTELARRGTIYSADGKIVAQSEDAFVLGVDYSKAPHSPGFFMALGAAAGIAPTEISQPAAAGLKSRVWRQRMTSEQAAEVQAVKQSWRADGVSLHRDMRRLYPLSESMACVVGTVRDGNPLSGIELGENAVLEGRNGLQAGMVDRTGAWLPSRMSETKRSRQNGQSVTLTVDSVLQVEATQAVRQAVEKTKAERGVAIVMDPKTGSVRAMACWPTYDPSGSNLQLGRYSDLNPAFQSIYEPGSTFKVLTLAKALDEGVVTPGSTVACGGTLKLNKYWAIHCDREHGAHGTSGIERAIAKSCNVSAATWALKVGYNDMVHYVEDLGLLERPGTGMPGEVRGQFNYKEYAKPLQIAQVGFGQSLSSTPLALCSAYAMLANGGVRMHPRVLDEVGGVRQPIAKGETILKPETADRVLHLMESVIQSDEGTGSKLRIPGYRLAGKTGTAQKIGGGKSGGHVASFVGFVPAQEPHAVILVMIDQPKGAQYYGGQVAGPVFRQLAQAVIRRDRIPADSQPARKKSPMKVEVSAKPTTTGIPNR
ncbi:MAG: penicillin-binding protein 2 [Fimbriimonadaceae bacterium]|nr:penicillin-binding protein 2 [Fimbriimonadaceae bacterium]